MVSKTPPVQVLGDEANVGHEHLHEFVVGELDLLRVLGQTVADYGDIVLEPVPIVPS